ncbi:cAMP-binding domain of CRP or a regulatory subunit of cAMP-dependent protein kinases [Ferrimonas sediminum]|uniref:cAMP-binding domain of CRP or a regulatory subunit of cAMP-dependent protein kinases n=1 Tax=Ferrimonas sediminum TaxID=718193 RepID=A0A1G8TVH9_9GAMM|nr:Crp/Fnr family transcriptional regulator [Ferrimonas sediminum]SDJ45576.1 cAMP-binding domain of CRP or a regulatory subunit of cAMP-dependent protein kinases [Ferrimonas sediminum]
MEHGFIAALTQLGVAAAQAEALFSQSSPRRCAPGEVLVAQHSHQNELFFVERGLCHAAYLTPQGKQFSKEFYWELDWVIGFEAWLAGTPSPFQLQALTEVQLRILPMSVLTQWRAERHPAHVTLLEQQLIYKERKERLMLLHSPSQRYALFCQDYPHLLRRLNDYQIAAYLGITHVSLSRIKARLRQN